MLQRAWEVRIIHIYNKANRAADFIAEFAKTLNLGNHRIDKPPAGLISWLVRDQLGIGENRVVPLHLV